MQPTNWFRRPLNKKCLYCARGFDDVVLPRKEHLIARQLVPSGSLNDNWNFIFTACEECNNRKSRLEGHVGAVTQLISPTVAKDSVYAQRSAEKARGEYHPWTKRPVADSFHESTFTGRLGSVGISTNFVGPPQLDRDQACELAFRHMQGVFALLMNVDHTADRLFLLSDKAFWPLRDFPRSDWGNRQVVAMHARTRNWKTLARIVTASGYFKCIVKRSVEPPETWYWMLEWNCSTRLVGGLGDPAGPPQFMTGLPGFEWARMPAPDGAMWRFRQEEPLPDGSDDFFDPGVMADTPTLISG